MEMPGKYATFMEGVEFLAVVMLVTVYVCETKEVKGFCNEQFFMSFVQVCKNREGKEI